jgi:hypothetical protein
VDGDCWLLNSNVKNLSQQFKTIGLDHE